MLCSPGGSPLVVVSLCCCVLRKGRNSPGRQPTQPHRTGLHSHTGRHFTLPHPHSEDPTPIPVPLHALAHCSYLLGQGGLLCWSTGLGPPHVGETRLGILREWGYHLLRPSPTNTFLTSLYPHLSTILSFLVWLLWFSCRITQVQPFCFPVPPLKYWVSPCPPKLLGVIPRSE